MRPRTTKSSVASLMDTAPRSPFWAPSSLRQSAPPVQTAPGLARRSLHVRGGDQVLVLEVSLLPPPSSFLRPPPKSFFKNPPTAMAPTTKSFQNLARRPVLAA